MTTELQDPKPAKPEEFNARAAAHDETRARILDELTALEDQAGAVMLDDPNAAENLAQRVAGLRVRADLEAKAAVEARTRAQAARVAGLRAQADALESAVRKARKGLSEHDEKRDRLRRSLEDFTGVPWTTTPVNSKQGRRQLSPRELLTSELEEVQQRQERLRGYADEAAADPAWVHPQAAEAARVAASWAETVAAYRRSADALAEALTVVDDAASARGCTREDVMAAPGGDYRSGQIQKACATVSGLEEQLRNFPSDVEFFRSQGLDLPADEARALEVELGLPELLDDEAVEDA